MKDYAEIILKKYWNRFLPINPSLFKNFSIRNKKIYITLSSNNYLIEIKEEEDFYNINLNVKIDKKEISYYSSIAIGIIIYNRKDNYILNENDIVSDKIKDFAYDIIMPYKEIIKYNFKNIKEMEDKFNVSSNLIRKKMKKNEKK